MGPAGPIYFSEVTPDWHGALETGAREPGRRTNLQISKTGAVFHLTEKPPVG